VGDSTFTSGLILPLGLPPFPPLQMGNDKQRRRRETSFDLKTIIQESIYWMLGILAFVAMVGIPAMTQVWWHSIPILIIFAVLYFAVVWLIGLFIEKDH
jgi:fatty acid desaturase